MNVAVRGNVVGERTESLWRGARGTGSLQMKVGAQTVVSKLAGAVARATRDGRDVELIAIGLPATYNAVKALARAREYLLDDAIALRTEVCWVLLEDFAPGKNCTALTFRVTASGGRRGGRAAVASDHGGSPAWPGEL